jgi:hypothetical protein
MILSETQPSLNKNNRNSCCLSSITYLVVASLLSLTSKYIHHQILPDDNLLRVIAKKPTFLCNEVAILIISIVRSRAG